jgi:hypothetical protein
MRAVVQRVLNASVVGACSFYEHYKKIFSEEAQNRNRTG